MPNTPRGGVGILLASNNAHTAAEIRRLFPAHRVLTPAEMGIEADLPETADTFRENAVAKALALLAHVRGRLEVLAVLADDSGLCVDALGGRPGVHSNRYGSTDGVLLSPEDKIRLLLREMAGVADRRARFVCALALAWGSERFVVAQETLEGRILDVPVGAGGFGYDPIFEIPELARSVAQLADTEKDRWSHRGRASRRIRAVLETSGPD